ncbi:hypothetical protein D3C80_912000 [compost metagenome]
MRLANLAAGGRAHIRLARLFQATPVHGEHPAVVATPDSFLLDTAVIKRGAAVSAARMQQSRTPRFVAKQDQIFTEHPDLTRRIAGVRRHADRMPVAAQQLAHRRAGSHPGQLVKGRGFRPSIAGRRSQGLGHLSFPLKGRA